MPAPLHEVWAYFRKDPAGSNYRTDKVHKAAWCAACFAQKVQSILAQEQLEHMIDINRPVRTVEEIELGGM